MFKVKPIFKTIKKFPFIKIYWFTLDEEKFQFVDDILVQLAKEPEFQLEDYIAPIVCNNVSDVEIFGKIYTTKDFIPQGKERLYFRIATFYLEEKKLIIVERSNPDNPKYLISYEGLILVKNGGLITELRNKYIKNFLEKTALVITILTFFLTVILFFFRQESNNSSFHLHLYEQHKFQNHKDSLQTEQQKSKELYKEKHKK